MRDDRPERFFSRSRGIRWRIDRGIIIRKIRIITNRERKRNKNKDRLSLYLVVDIGID